MAEKSQGDPDWLIFGPMSIPEPMIVVRSMALLTDLLEGVGRVSLSSVPRGTHSLLERGVLLLEEREEGMPEDEAQGPLGILNIRACSLSAPSPHHSTFNASSRSVKLMNK